MKKIAKILIPILTICSATVFTSCNNKKEENGKVLLNFGDIHSKGVIDDSDDNALSVDELVNKIEEKNEPMLLAISTEFCGCWSSFRPLVDKYVKDNQLICYHKTDKQMGAYIEKYGIKFVAGKVTLAIIENGKAKYSIVHDYDKEETTVQSKFNELMDGLIEKPKFYYVTEDDVKTMKASDKSEIIYYSRSGCGDCTYINKSILCDYSKEKDFNQKIYVLDCQKFVRSSDDPNYNLYLEKKDELGLSTKNNPKYGYNAGVFPYLTLIENGVCTTAAVCYNETLTKVNDKVVITDNYYDGSRNLKYTDVSLLNTEVPEGKYVYSEKYDYYSWDRKASTEAYKPLIYSFLDYAIPKITYTF